MKLEKEYKQHKLREYLWAKHGKELFFKAKTKWEKETGKTFEWFGFWNLGQLKKIQQDLFEELFKERLADKTGEKILIEVKDIEEQCDVFLGDIQEDLESNKIDENCYSYSREYIRQIKIYLEKPSQKTEVKK